MTIAVLLRSAMHEHFVTPERAVLVNEIFDCSS